MNIDEENRQYKEITKSSSFQRKCIMQPEQYQTGIPMKKVANFLRRLHNI